MLGFVGGRCAYRLPPPQTVEPDEPAVTLVGPVERTWDPWRRTTPHALLVPVAALRAIAIPDDLARVYRDRARHEHVAASIERHGLREPLEVHYDHRRIVLLDGHNRLTGTSRTHLPVEFVRVDRLTGYAVPLTTFLAMLAAPPES